MVPDCRGVDQNFHDVTIVDMGDVPESHIPLSELSTLSQQWPPAVISHMGRHQKELEEMCMAAKKQFPSESAELLHVLWGVDKV